MTQTDAELLYACPFCFARRGEPCTDGGTILDECHPDRKNVLADKESAQVCAMGNRVGFGRMMQLCSDLWKKSLVNQGISTGGEFTVGPCAAEMVPCVCEERDTLAGHCDWCCGTGRLTKAVRKLIGDTPGATSTGFQFVGLDNHGEAEIRLSINEIEGTIWLSREMWDEITRLWDEAVK